MFDKLEDLLVRLEEILSELNEPGVANDPARFQKLMKEQSELQPLVDTYKEYKENKETIQDSLSMLEEERLLHDILHTQDGNGVIVTIGQENKYSGIQDCSVIQASFRIDGQTVGTLAVLGPTRMEYARTMAAIEFMQKHMEQILKKYQR